MGSAGVALAETRGGGRIRQVMASGWRAPRSRLPSGFRGMTTANPDSSTTKSESTPKVVVQLSRGARLDRGSSSRAGSFRGGWSCDRSGGRPGTGAPARGDGGRETSIPGRGDRIGRVGPSESIGWCGPANDPASRVSTHRPRRMPHRTFRVGRERSSRGDLPRAAVPEVAFFERWEAAGTVRHAGSTPRPHPTASFDAAPGPSRPGPGPDRAAARGRAQARDARAVGPASRSPSRAAAAPARLRRAATAAGLTASGPHGAHDRAAQARSHPSARRTPLWLAGASVITPVAARRR